METKLVEKYWALIKKLKAYDFDFAESDSYEKLVFYIKKNGNKTRKN